MDEWLKTHLRLAERQGLLLGRHLSPVQGKALEVLRLLDLIEKVEGDWAGIKRAMGATGQWKWAELFPDFFGQPEKAEEVSFDTTTSPIVYDVEWKSPRDAAQEYDKLMSELARNQNGVLSGADVVNEQSRDWR